jgi:hypothetical protein
VRFLDALLGRSKPAGANLDRLFALPGAAITLQASEGMITTGKAAVCFKPTVGPGFTETEAELASLLESGPDGEAPDALRGRTTLARGTDSFGYRWVVVEAHDVDELVTRVHFVNSTLEAHGYGPQLLCSVFGFGSAPTATALEPLGGAGLPEEGPMAPAPTASRASTYLVYLYKRGSFYPFVPTGKEQRDNEAELRLKALLADDLAIEPELDRWFPLWELPIS